MLSNYRWMILILAGLLGIVFFAGCARNEKREVKVIHEQHEGEVEQTPPGEMVVE